MKHGFFFLLGFGALLLVSCQSQPLEQGVKMHEMDNTEKTESLHWPMENFQENVTLKFFGTYIQPENSPVQPERFRGYHTGIDVEISPDQMDEAIAVYALKDGEVLLSRWVSGYGGVLVLGTELNGSPCTILYGHLDIDRSTYQVGDEVRRGDILAYLGQAYSNETDGERKHLHLAIHQGQEIHLAGYVQNEAELLEWIDPLSLF